MVGRVGQGRDLARKISEVIHKTDQSEIVKESISDKIIELGKKDDIISTRRTYKHSSDVPT